MDNYFETILLEALLKTEGYYINNGRNGFTKLYPFTTENINGYIKNFNLSSKSLLTIGSSTDQLINAILSDCKDITILDICPFTKFYFYLKVSAIKTLEYNDFFKFFCYKDYPRFCKDNKEAFNLEAFNLIKPIPDDAIALLINKKKIYFFEEGQKSGGIAERLGCILLENGYSGKYSITAVDDKFVEQASVSDLLNKYGLDNEAMIKKISEEF